jgi:hypothetical protein
MVPEHAALPPNAPMGDIINAILEALLLRFL